jgi:hypothetical protein
LGACNAATLATGDGGGGAAGGDAATLAADAGAAGFALSFDGVRQYATTGNGGFPQAGEAQTVEMWVKYSSLAGRQTFFTMRMGFDSGVKIGIHDGTVGVWRVYVDRVLAAAPTPPPVDEWHHIAYTFDLTNHTLYVDGAVAHTQVTSNDNRTPVYVFVGSVDGLSELLKGELDELRVWSVARTAAEVAADMRDRSAGAAPGLVAHWSFDDVANGGRSLDLSGHGNHVTLGDGIAQRMPSRVTSGVPVGL